MKDHASIDVFSRIGQLLYRFRTPLLFWVYLIAMMAYAYKWMPN